MTLWYEKTSGPAHDLERFKRQRNDLTVRKLAVPRGFKVPLNAPYTQFDPDRINGIQMYQAQPLPDPYFRTTTGAQLQQAIAPSDSINPLVFNRFVGTTLQQVNVPDGLSVAEPTEKPFQQPTPWLVPSTYFSSMSLLLNASRTWRVYYRESPSLSTSPLLNTKLQVLTLQGRKSQMPNTNVETDCQGNSCDCRVVYPITRPRCFKLRVTPDAKSFDRVTVYHEMMPDHFMVLPDIPYMDVKVCTLRTTVDHTAWGLLYNYHGNGNFVKSSVSPFIAATGKMKLKYMAAHTYSNEPLEGYAIDEPLSGAHQTVYVKGSKATIAFRGTDLNDRHDINADLSIAGGIPELDPSFQTAVSNAEKVIHKYGAGNVRTTGHSLGGTKAFYVSHKTGIPATGFNPGWSPSLLQRSNIMTGWNLKNSHPSIYPLYWSKRRR